METDLISGQNIKKTARFLKKIISVKSLPGQEENLIQILKDDFLPLCDAVRLVKITEKIKQNPLYCSVKDGLSYKNRHNLVLKGNGYSSKNLIINAHADVVPAPEEMFSPYEKDGIIYGRGACDDKGQIASIYMLLNAIKDSGKKICKNLEIHIVNEEEIGGNGTLALMEQDFNAGFAIIMEPTDLKILTGNRGAVWFKAKVKGVAGHSGEAKSVKSALLKAISLMDILKACHGKIFNRLKGAHPFEDFENPMPLTFGKLHSGQWPATAPREAILEGVFGFLPGMTAKAVIDEIKKSIKNAGTEISGYTDISFPLQRDPSVTSRDLSSICDFSNAVRNAGIIPVYSALPAFCDMWFYTHQKAIPALIFGAGKLKHAHSDIEQVKLDDIKLCALSIYNFLIS
jgi:acetylornithine deacetylase/succinyl-diaminopimelate desuccinylase-like protein